MLRFEGAVEYAEVKRAQNGKEYGQCAIEGLFLFCYPDNMPKRGQFIRGMAQQRVQSYVDQQTGEVKQRRSLSLFSWEPLVLSPAV